MRLTWWSRKEGCDYTVQRLVLGTHTSDNDQNYLQIAEVKMPTMDVELKAPLADADDAKGGMLRRDNC